MNWWISLFPPRTSLIGSFYSLKIVNTLEQACYFYLTSELNANYLFSEPKVKRWIATSKRNWMNHLKFICTRVAFCHTRLTSWHAFPVHLTCPTRQGTGKTSYFYFWVQCVLWLSITTEINKTLSKTLFSIMSEFCRKCQAFISIVKNINSREKIV